MADNGELIPYQQKVQPTRRLSPLSAKHVRFCEMIFSGTKPNYQCYLETCAESPATHIDTAKSAARKLLRRPAVREYLRLLQEYALSHSRATVDHILSGLNAVAFSDRTAIFNDDGSMKPPDKWPRDFKEAVESIEIKEFYSNKKDKETGEITQVVSSREFKVKCGSRLRALELLMQFRKMIGHGATEINDADLPLTVGGEASRDAV